MAHLAKIVLLKRAQRLFNQGLIAEGNEVLEEAIEELEILLGADPPLTDPRLERLRIMTLRQEEAFRNRRQPPRRQL